MAPASIHQVVHGYRDGHRLLSSSIQLSADAARTMLVLSDMSGPSMQPAFEEYLTGYPLPSANVFVLAKTWYAPEMRRPGCVWTHSLLIPRAQVSDVTAAGLLDKFQRPQLEGVGKAAAVPLAIDDAEGVPSEHGFGDRAVAAALIGAVLGQSRPVIVAVDTAAQLEALVLRVWEELWPAERARFSFCTGALIPRSNAGELLDLQTVPRTIPLSQFRKSASAALVLDIRALGKSEPWVDLVLDRAMDGDTTFRIWLEAAAGSEAKRSIVPSLAPIFDAWHAPGSSARSILAKLVNAKDLDPAARGRLVRMVFERADTEARPTRRRELLQDLCREHYGDISPTAAMLEDQIATLFEQSRAEGIVLVLSLLGSELTEIGERALRAGIRLLVPSDLETFDDAQVSFLPTIAGSNPLLATSTVLWRRVGRSAEVLSQLASADLTDEERGSVIDAVISSGCDVSVDGFVQFGGKVAMLRGLNALSSAQIPLSWQWRTALSAQPDVVLEWLEGSSSPSLHDLEIATQLLSPKATQTRLANVWKTRIADIASLAPRVATFGLSLAFSERDANSPLLSACFQRTYDAAGSSRLDYQEWDWLRDYAPSVSWYRDWDKCERLAAAVARLFREQDASLDTVFRVVHSREAVKKVANVLDGGWETRTYLRSLRNAADGTAGIGTREQREALLEEW